MEPNNRIHERPQFKVKQVEGAEVVDLDAWAKRCAQAALQLEGWRVTQTPQAA